MLLLIVRASHRLLLLSENGRGDGFVKFTGEARGPIKIVAN